MSARKSASSKKSSRSKDDDSDYSSEEEDKLDKKSKKIQKAGKDSKDKGKDSKDKGKDSKDKGKDSKEKAPPVDDSDQKGYTADQLKQYKKLLVELNGWTNVKLKEVLKKNEQSMSGNKDQLVQKVADGKVMGKIPRCPKCFGGRPRYDYIKGTYHCHGYRDDEDMVECDKELTKEELPRETWTD